jgi:hypothetical protein
LSIPNPDGSFNASSASSFYKDGASVYRFEINNRLSPSRAKFQIDEKEASIKLALPFPHKSIEPVCEALNAHDPMAKTIVTEEPGEVVLEGNKWKLTRKAKIRYE